MKQTKNPYWIIAAMCSLGLMAGAEDRTEVGQLKSELKMAKTKINELEEQLYIATDGQAMEEAEAAAALAEGVYPWTEYMRRTTTGILFQKTATICKGEFFGRFSHVSQNQSFANGRNPLHDLMGLESGVKVGIMFGYGILDNWDVTIQRTNGRKYTYEDVNYNERSFDLWDVMTKVKLLDEFKQYIDLALLGGFTCFWQSNDTAEYAANAAILAEKSFWRFRVGSGLLYTSLSDFENTFSAQDATADAKGYINDVTVSGPRPSEHTVAIPLSLSMALTKNLAVFGEAAFPIDGYDTGKGPSAAAGCRITTHSHAYSLFLSNTSNNSFNSTFTGGYKHDRMDIFGFDISIFF